MTTRNSRVAIITLPILAFFILFTVINAEQSHDQTITASTAIHPNATVYCEPRIVNLNSVGYLTCFIELEGADASDIDVSTVEVSVKGKAGSVNAELSPTLIDDFNFNGISDLMVEFKISDISNNIFASFTTPAYFDFVLSGIAKGFDFSGVDVLYVIKPNAVKLVRYLRLDARDLGYGELNRLDGLNLTDHVATFNDFRGYFFLTSDSKLHGQSTFYFQGNVKTQQNLNFFGLKFSRKLTTPIRVLAFMDEMKDCFAFDQYVHCDGSGYLLIKPGKRVDLNHFTFEIKDGKAKIEGGEFFNDILSVTDIPITNIKIKYWA
jgi:hypothetical protein